MRQKHFSYILILILFPLTILAQQNRALSLLEILQQIEKQHNVSFNYLDSDVFEIKIIAPKKALSLHSKIDYIKSTTELDFHFINAKTISISKRIKQPETKAETQQTLEEVTIKNYLTSGINKKLDGSFLIRPQQFGILPGLTEPDVLQTMQQIPGIISVDETVSNINVRGGTQDQNLFLWNGIRMFQTGHFFGLISAFNPLLAQDIRIYKNGSSAFLGESVSSAISISTKVDSIQKNNSAVELNLISISFFSRIKTSEKSSFTISGRRSLTDFMTTPTYQNYADRIFQNTVVTNLSGSEIVDYQVSKKFYFYDFSAQYQLKIGQKHELTIGAIGISNNLNISQYKPEVAENNTKKSNLEQQNFGANLNWKTKWNSNSSTSVTIYGSAYTLTSQNESVQSTQNLQQQNSILLTGIRIENNHRIHKNFQFNNGYEFNETGISNHDRINLPQFSRKIKDVLRIHSAILEGKFDSEDRRLFLKTGLRINYIEEFSKWLFEPRFQFSYRLTNKLKLEILGEIKSQTSSQVIDLQRDFLGIEKRRWILADDERNPIQQSRQISAGLVFSDAEWLLTIDNFYKKINGISTPGQFFQNQLEFLKINGNYTVWGSEILIQRTFDRFNSWISYSWNHNEYEFPGYIPPHFPNNFAIAHTVSAAAIYDYKKFKIALGSRWFSGKPNTTPLTVNSNTEVPVLIYNNPNNENLSDYFQVNASISRSWNLSKNSNLSVGFSIQNLLNKRNIINRHYRINTTENTTESVNTYSLERTPNLSVKLSF